MMKTFSVCPEAPQPTIRVRTDGAVKLFTFRRKAQADKKIMELLRTGYTFDATRQTTEEVPASIAECDMCYTTGPCVEGEHATVCADREACQARIQGAAIDLPSVLEIEDDAPDSEFYAAAQPPEVLSPTEALRLALERGIFGLPETVAKLQASLEAADQEALERAEQLAAARQHAAAAWDRWQIEIALGAPF